MDIKKRVFLIASSSLLVGILFYLFLYPEKFRMVSFGYIDFEPYKLHIKNEYIKFFVYSITSYVYIIFMTFYSVLITNKITTRIIYYWAIFWGVISSIFEILQNKEISSSITSNIWLFNIVNDYLEKGSFDITDILFIWLGVISTIYLWPIINTKKV